jgi:hypothetical protein
VRDRHAAGVPAAQIASCPAEWCMNGLSTRVGFQPVTMGSDELSSRSAGSANLLTRLRLERRRPNLISKCAFAHSQQPADWEAISHSRGMGGCQNQRARDERFGWHRPSSHRSRYPVCGNRRKRSLQDNAAPCDTPRYHCGRNAEGAEMATVAGDRRWVAARNLCGDPNEARHSAGDAVPVGAR